MINKRYFQYFIMRKKYPSDVSREQFGLIEEILEQARKKTKPRVLDLYDIFCGALYILRTGCQWRALPSDLPKWRTVYEYFRLWTAPRKGKITILEYILKKISKKREEETEEKSKDQLSDC